MPVQPSGGMPTSVFDGPHPAPPRGPRRSAPRVPVLPVLACALVVVVAAVAFFALRGSGHNTAAVADTPSATATASSPAALRRAAVALSALLARSVADRTSVIQAVTEVRSCGTSLDQDARTFTEAAKSRQTLLSRLGRMPGRLLLSAAMIQDLTTAWQASAQADRDLARWARDEASGCTPRKSASDPNLQASYVPDGEATTSKKAFTLLWNPIANRYGLTNYQWDQL
jgi:hypothetical protein